MEKITVIGAGQMGNGIAQVIAQQFIPVTLVDVSASALEKAMATIGKNLDRMIAKSLLDAASRDKVLSSIQTTTDLAKAALGADLVIEAATENPAIKFQLFRDLDNICPPKAILATNTSSISITSIASHTKRSSQVIGMHFMNPVPVMKLVEVIRGYNTSDEVNDQIVSLSKQLGKIPVEVNDFPGFVANRILMPMINEAISALHQGVAGVVEIDQVMKLGMSHPMGPLQLADFIGLDTCLAILKVLHEGFGETKYAPNPLLVAMVTAGKMGVKSGEGFYEYQSGSKDLKPAKRFRK